MNNAAIILCGLKQAGTATFFASGISYMEPHTSSSWIYALYALSYKIIDLFSSAYSTHDLSSAFVNAAPVGLLFS